MQGTIRLSLQIINLPRKDGLECGENEESQTLQQNVDNFPPMKVCITVEILKHTFFQGVRNLH